MSIFRFVAALALSAAVAAIGGGAKAAGGMERCSLVTEYQVSTVQKYTTETVGGYSQAYTQFRGAELYVAAQPGLTQEWLQRKLEIEIANGECNFGVPNVKVDVLSAGGGFRVRLTGPDERAANEILRNAQPLAR